MNPLLPRKRSTTLAKAAAHALKRTNLRYPAFGHGAGDVIWWVGNDGKVKIFVSTGHEMHHDLDRRLDMDARWRGRLEPATGVVTMQPPRKMLIAAGPRDTIAIPARLLRALRRRGGIRFLVALLDGRLHALIKK